MIDPVTGKAGTPVPVSRLPSALAYDGARLWVADWSNDTVQSVLVHKRVNK